MIGKTREYLNAQKTEYIEIVMKNAILLEISGNYEFSKTIGSDGSINELVIGPIVYDIGSNIDFKIDDVQYSLKIVQILEKTKGVFQIRTDVRNKSSLFIMPALGEDWKHFSVEKYFANSYLTRDGNNTYNKIYLVYRSHNSNDYVKLEERLLRHPNYVDSYDFESTSLLIEFNIPASSLPDVIKFVVGAYSKMSESIKDKVLRFWKGFHIDQAKKLSQVFTKDKDMANKIREDLGLASDFELKELMSKPNMKDEDIVI